MVVSRTRWLRPGRAVDGVLAAACVAAGVWRDLQSGLFDGSPVVDRPAPLALTAALGVVTGLAVFDRRRRPLALYAGAVSCWLVAGAWPAIPIAQYAVGAHVGSPRLRVVLTIGMVAVVSTPMWLAYGGDASLPISLALCILPVLAGLYLASRRALVASLEERARRNEREQRLRIDQARAEERAQIARDMHDVVTHRVSLMVLHATALESAQGRDAVATAGQIQTIGRAALEELRTLVGVLRDGGAAPLRPQPGIADLAELVTASQALGLAVDLSIEDGLRAPSLVEHAVYRVVQEALTNVHKHARTARTEVVVTSDGEGVRLAVRNGAGAATIPAESGGGHGLLGIGERVRLVGGTLRTRRLPDGGFEVVARMPVANVPGEVGR
jgi:signal transduction histidine kinase